MRRALFLTALAVSLGSCNAAPAPAARTPQGPPPGPQGAPSPAPADPAAPATPPAARPNTQPLPAAAGVRYLEVVTAGARAEDPLPMLVAIHGLGDDPRGFSGLVRDLPVPARVILPQGLDPHPPGWSWFPIRARDPDVDALVAGIDRAADRLAAMIEALARSRPTAGRPVVTGFSQGGMLTFNLAVRHPDLLSAAFPVGGWLPPPSWPATRAPAGAPPIHALHGDADRAVRYGPTKEAVEALRAKGWSVELSTYPHVGHAIPPPMAAELHALLVEALAAQAEPP